MTSSTATATTIAEAVADGTIGGRVWIRPVGHRP
jgi:hypothetical protein